MTDDTIAHPRIVSAEDWSAARKDLLVREKELPRQRDAVNAQRRRLPMVRIEKEYVFDGLAAETHVQLIGRDPAEVHAGENAGRR